MQESEIVLRLVVATLVGAAIGLNREFHHKQSGLKTLGLVSLGAAVAVTAIVENSQDPNSFARVIQGLVVGVGFVGAGVIVREQNSHRVRGLTTAAAVWLTACLGAACGAGAWISVATGTVCAAVLLIVGRRVEKRLRLALGDNRSERAAQRSRDATGDRPTTGAAPST